MPRTRHVITYRVGESDSEAHNHYTDNLWRIRRIAVDKAIRENREVIIWWKSSRRDDQWGPHSKILPNGSIYNASFKQPTKWTLCGWRWDFEQQKFVLIVKQKESEGC